jgi:hypothetical protein
MLIQKIRENEREKQWRLRRPFSLSPHKPEMQRHWGWLDKPKRRHRFWCEACGYIIQACVHRVIDVER